MARTPEGKVKDMVKRVLAEFEGSGRWVGDYHVGWLYQFWPVPSGYGASSLDCLVTYYGVSIFIETKAPGKAPTPRQEMTIAQIRGAGGMEFVIDGEAGCERLRRALMMIRLSHANHS